MANVQNLAENQEFIEKLANTQSPEEALALLEENGVTITKEELLSAVEAANTENDGELSENALDSVSGGCVVATACLSAAILYAGHKTLQVTGSYKWYKTHLLK